MKSFRIFSSACIVFLTLITSLTSCTKKETSTDAPGDLTDLQGFPKEWVLVDDIAPPDSITRNYVIPVDSSNSFIGGITIKQNGSDWQMINEGFFYPGTYVIKNCKRRNEAEMVYYEFDLRSTQDSTQLTFTVNFRHHPEDPAAITSVFTCSSCEDHPDVQMAEKSLVNRFPIKPLSELQYD